MHNANITDFTPLAPGHFIAVLKPGEQKDQPEILLGEVLTITTQWDPHPCTVILDLLGMQPISMLSKIHATHAAVQLLIKARHGGGPVVADALPNGTDDAEDLGAEGVDGKEDTFSSDEDI
ncbi:hypothetical protein SERLADRAFT_443570 [Serpula lacrymans var. lacrymans S7.9]|uniref:Uncharacterized protein n=1 Tax=Serpula lacrymans var. lacrymans (strain S7.9) TaxID=578457 RepID=F8PCT8_SERL9|nr:uncharacterized protein SERLADRAFT_443570 [Serpula lacrymans var. lacrymans S7.9]EGO19037.1 hypothetical protein SERLADRAFT_443570 [Serpula lacrymans var. lacrymans S7.9]